MVVQSTMTNIKESYSRTNVSSCKQALREFFSTSELSLLN